MAVWVQHRQNTSWEPAIVASQSSSNSYWIMQENGSDQPKVYRRTRSMLKIRCTDVWHPTPEYSHLTENQKAKFHLHTFLMRKETLSGTILSIKYQAILLPRQNRVLPLCLILYFQKERRKSQKSQKMHLQKMNLHLHPHWRQSKNDHTLQEQGSQQERTFGNQPAHIVTFTCETLS